MLPSSLPKIIYFKFVVFYVLTFYNNLYNINIYPTVHIFDISNDKNYLILRWSGFHDGDWVFSNLNECSHLHNARNNCIHYQNGN